MPFAFVAGRRRGPVQARPVTQVARIRIVAVFLPSLAGAHTQRWYELVGKVALLADVLIEEQGAYV